MSRMASPRHTSTPLGAKMVTSICGRRSLQPPSGITCTQGNEKDAYSTGALMAPRYYHECVWTSRDAGIDTGPDESTDVMNAH